MKKILLSIFALATICVQAADFTPGNVVVVRVGGINTDGVGTQGGFVTISSNGNTAPVSILEFNANTANQAAPIQTINLNTDTTTAVLTLGNNKGEGQLELTQDGKNLILLGYDRPVNLGLSTTNQNKYNNHRFANKTIFMLNKAAEPTYLSFLYVESANPTFNARNGGAVRNVVSVDGTAFWAKQSAESVLYLTAADPATIVVTGVQPTNTGRGLKIYKDQLYEQTNGTVSFSTPALPTASGATVAAMRTAGTGGDQVGFVMFDMDPLIDWNGTGFDVLYMAHAANGIEKYFWNPDLTVPAWVQASPNYAVAGGYSQLTGMLVNGKAVLFTTAGGGGVSANNTLVKYVDNQARTEAITSPTITTLATAGANYIFKGVSLTPETNLNVASVKTLKATEMGVYAQKGGIVFKSASKYKITNSIGQVVAQGVTTADNQYVSVNAKGIVIVKINNQSAKLIIKD